MFEKEHILSYKTIHFQGIGMTSAKNNKRIIKLEYPCSNPVKNQGHLQWKQK